MRIMLVDDHKIMREGLKALFEKQSGMEVVAEAGNGLEAVRLARDLSPDLVLMDVAMPGLNGIEATRKIIAENPKIKVVALTKNSDRRCVVEMFRSGVSGYVLKDCSFEELACAVETVVKDGRFFISPGIVEIVIKDYINMLSKHEEPSAFSVLTVREREVLQLIAEGKTTSKIALSLNLSEKTVETHRRQIMHKLNLHSIADLTKYAIREGLTAI
ncbi:MAG: response regulator transcription factor [Peptococcaceae bacterium]|nr:response regulator transcription factor [Peptococcaceae bacterium]